MNKTLGQFRARLSSLMSIPAIGPVIVLLLASTFFATQSKNFLTGTNLSLIIQQVMVVGALAIGQTLVILTSGIDLSNGMVMAFSSVLMVGLAADQGLNPLVAVGVGLLVCALFGAFNGSLITFVRLPPLIVTLGTLNIVFALIRIYTTQTIVAPESLLFFGQTFKIGNTAITYGSVLMFVMFLITWFILRSTTAGRNLYAMGDNPEAARLAGINTARLTIGIYTVAALMYGVAGLLLASRTGVGDPNAGQNANLDSITAVVLGGTSTLGGRGNIMGTLVGVLIVGVFRNGLQLMGVDSIYQVLVTGILFIAAVSVDQLSHRGSK